jgi:hypothetical protein
MGSEEYPEDEMLNMPAEVQLLPPDKEREKDIGIISIHLDSIMLLTTSREVRETLRELQVYAVVREVHAAVENEDIREHCERIVNVLKRDEADENAPEGAWKEEEAQIQEIDEDDEIVDLV